MHIHACVRERALTRGQTPWRRYLIPFRRRGMPRPYGMVRGRTLSDARSALTVDRAGAMNGVPTEGVVRPRSGGVYAATSADVMP